MTEAGIHVVVAAGNEDMDACDSSPAREATAVTVGASTDGDQRLWLSRGAPAGQSRPRARRRILRVSRGG